MSIYDEKLSEAYTNLKDNFLAVVTGPNTKEEFYKLGVSADNVLKSLVDFNNTLF